MDLTFRLKITVFTVVVVLFLLSSCSSSYSEELRLKISDQTAVVFDSLVDIRRDLHQHPEIAGQEQRTSIVIVNYLKKLGLEVKTDVAGYGVVGILNAGKRGKKIAWRADMDALKMNHSDSTDFASQVEGVGHMCGHDVHTTIGLGIANVLTSLKEEIDGTVYFIFQPSEETFKGAKAMVEHDFFKGINLDEIYALHVFPSKVGTISTKPNELFAYEKTLEVTLKKEVNQKEFSTYLQKLLQEFTRSKSGNSPQSLNFLTDQDNGLENPSTIYQDYLILFGGIHTEQTDSTASFTSTFFETDRNRLDSMLNQIQGQVLNSTYRDDFISIRYSRGNPTVDNDAELVQSILKREAALGSSSVTPLYGQVPYFNEDFIYFQQKVPGVLFFLGASNTEKNISAMPHTPDFVVDENAIKHGVNYFSSLIIDRVNN